jgi:hypothetical protein
MDIAFSDYFRCPSSAAEFEIISEASRNAGYFRFGPDATCYGRCSVIPPAAAVTDELHDLLHETRLESYKCGICFDPTEVVNNLRHERYVSSSARKQADRVLGKLIRDAYYGIRPVLPIAFRKHLQRLSLRGWDREPFPRWPVDRTVDNLMGRLMALSLKAKRVQRIPFIWFWPEGRSSCVIMTHDVESSAGLDFCWSLMNINDAFSIKSSFQVVPEGRYTIPRKIIEQIWHRGFELNIHDFNHDGNLYRERSEFLRRAVRINKYARQYGAMGFRSGVLYRNLDWYDAFTFSYDMSVPNVAHLDPQPGGCCTVMPYFIGEILELPVTTTQDYSLFYILGDHSIELWKQQIQQVMESHGLVSFIVHPDYIIEKSAQKTYQNLLEYLSRLRSESNAWITLPAEVNAWWRQRSKMRLVQREGSWEIEGAGKERARIAYAIMDGDRVSFDVVREAA